MASFKWADCACELPCSCIEFENRVYDGMESIIDDLVQQREDLLTYLDALERSIRGDNLPGRD